MNDFDFNDLFSALTQMSTQTGITVWWVVKFVVVIGLLIYTGFGVMIVRQVDLMSRSLNGAFKKPLKTIAWGYFIAIIGTLVGILVFG